MPGCAIVDAARASLKNRCTIVSSLENCGSSILSAARRPSCVCSAT
jgi:hypothetical protein